MRRKKAEHIEGSFRNATVRMSSSSPHSRSYSTSRSICSTKTPRRYSQRFLLMLSLSASRRSDRRKSVTDELKGGEFKRKDKSFALNLRLFFSPSFFLLSSFIPCPSALSNARVADRLRQFAFSSRFFGSHRHTEKRVLVTLWRRQT